MAQPPKKPFYSICDTTPHKQNPKKTRGFEINGQQIAPLFSLRYLYNFGNKTSSFF